MLTLFYVNVKIQANEPNLCLTEIWLMLIIGLHFVGADLTPSLNFNTALIFLLHKSVKLIVYRVKS